MLRSRAEGDEDLFFSIALQIAAAEARQGRRETAQEMRAEIDKARGKTSRGASVPVSFSSPRGNLEGLLEMREPRYKLNDVVLNERLMAKFADIIRQQRKRDWLREHGKTPNRRVLFVGPPGSGKTMSAEALAGELHLPLFVIRLEVMITRYMGETAAKLRLIFDETSKRRGGICSTNSTRSAANAWLRMTLPRCGASSTPSCNSWTRETRQTALLFVRRTIPPFSTAPCYADTIRYWNSMRRPLARSNN